MSKGEETSGGRQNAGLLANATEAFLGALYLDQGYTTVYKFLEKNLFPRLTEIQAKKLYKDPKSQLQELVQSQGFSAPEYVVVAEEGPDHDRSFTVQVKVGGKVVGEGSGKSKQLAQQEAAQKVLEHPEVVTGQAEPRVALEQIPK
jgi:ribonuclease-3